MIIQLSLYLYRSLFWSCIDLGIIDCFWRILGVYILRYRESIRIGNLFQETNGYVYINLQLATYVNDVFIFLLGFCCFFDTVKCLGFCRFHRRLSLFSETLGCAKRFDGIFIDAFDCIYGFSDPFLFLISWSNVELFNIITYSRNTVSK